MFAYCNNNPANCYDNTGALPCQNTMRMTSDSGLNVGARAYLNNRNLNSVHNAIADSKPSISTANRIVNDQNKTTGESFQYGRYSASRNACETIAVHNAKVLLGIDSTLSETMNSFQSCGAMILNGYFGSNPYAIGRVLKSEGIAYSRVGITNMERAGIYIISFWNDSALRNGLHTIAISYDGSNYTAYNLYGNGKVTDLSLSDYRDSFICGYYLGD